MVKGKILSGAVKEFYKDPDRKKKKADREETKKQTEKGKNKKGQSPKEQNKKETYKREQQKNKTYPHQADKQKNELPKKKMAGPKKSEKKN